MEAGTWFYNVVSVSNCRVVLQVVVLGKLLVDKIGYNYH